MELDFWYFYDNGEHFRLFPDLLKCIADNTILKLNQNIKGVDHVNQRLSCTFQKIVVCENCLYYDSISEFYSAHRYCIECTCDHACCPICKIGYHAVNISEWARTIDPPAGFVVCAVTLSRSQGCGTMQPRLVSIAIKHSARILCLKWFYTA